MVPEAPLRLALLDSGVLRHHPFVTRLEAELRVGRRRDGELLVEPAAGDELGHGTACAAVIRTLAPDVRLYSVKVFDDDLATTVDRLAAAIEWVGSSGIDVVNLSLGTTMADDVSPLDEACRRALDRGVVLVAAGEPGSRAVYPAALPGVVSVYAHPACRWGEYVIDEACPWRVGASGDPVRLPGVPTGANFHGSSIAASHVSGLICRVMQATGARGAEAVLRLGRGAADVVKRARL